MKFVSTRGKAAPVYFSEALRRGLAEDGGLFVPETFPRFELNDFERLESLPEIATRVLTPFFEGDPLAPELGGICAAALDFPVPLKFLARETAVLELFHGPTAAFKDVAARFLAECLTRLRKPADPVATVIVATSGDTGGAVAGAFFGKPGIEVVVLFPKGKVSSRQEKQLTCWGGNVHAFSVRGDFDDCQKMVKTALADPWWQRNKRLVSANSINIGRLLPQTTYYARASLEYARRTGSHAGVIIPSGNLGNAVAAIWARKMGFPIETIVLATNANRPIAEYFKTGRYAPFPTVATLANAMDVGNPSNMERLLHQYPRLEDLKHDVATFSATDDDIRETIRRGARDWGETWCPHTAAGVFAREQIGGKHWIVAATAHPSKFDTIVEPLIGSLVPIPPELKRLLDRPSESTEIEPALDALRAALE